MQSTREKSSVEKAEVLVVGYPKSGNTWLARLVAELISCPVKGFWESTHDEMAIEGSNRQSDYVVFKGHQGYENVCQKIQHKHLIYIVRDVRDVVISGANYYKFPAKSENAKINQMIWMVDKGGRKYPASWCSIPWDQHVLQYLDNGVLFIKYEDLLINPEAECQKICSNIGIERSKKQIAAAIKNQSFATVKEKFKLSGDKRRENFLRRGKSGDWTEKLTTEQKNFLTNRFFHALSVLNYLEPTGTIANKKATTANVVQIKLTKAKMKNINSNESGYINLALNKPTAQSSVYQPKKYSYNPHGACNGKKNGGFSFHTLKQDCPWWQVDLQGTYQLSEIRVYNRINFEERARTLNILLSHDALNWKLLYSNDIDNLFGGINGNPLIVDVNLQVARYVRLQLQENEPLHLDEVEIYGIPQKVDASEPKCNMDEATLYANFYGQASRQPSPHIVQNAIMSMLSKLRMQDTELGKVRVGNRGDGGYVIPNDLAGIKGVVSIGIGREVSFDKHFADMGVKVFQYDHTVESPPIIHNNFLFNKIGWGSQDSNSFITLSKILENNGLDEGDLILKLDVENAEWDALLDVQPDLLKRFRIVTCELHYFDRLEDISVFSKVNRVISLLTANHKVVHIHPNNCCGTVLVAGVVLPKLIGFSFLRNDRALFDPSHKSIPSSLDYPNVQSKAEIVLTPFHTDIKKN